MSISTIKLREFICQMVKEYNDETTLDTLTNLQPYRGELQNGQNFVQIGKRVNLPKEFFYENSTTHIAGIHQSFINSLTTSEEQFILSRVENASQRSELETASLSEFEYSYVVDKISAYIDYPDHIYIPNKTEYRKRLYKWEQATPDEDKHCYVLEPFSLEVHWMPSNWGYSDAFVIDSDAINVIQKKFHDVQPPEYIDHVSYDLDIGEDHNLMVYLGDHPDNSDEFDFFYRVIVSEPEFTKPIKGSAFTLQLPETDTD